MSSSNLRCKKKASNKFVICSWCWWTCPRMVESEIPFVIEWDNEKKHLRQVWRTLCWELTNTIIYLKSICRYHLTSLVISNKQPGKWVFSTLRTCMNLGHLPRMFPAATIGAHMYTHVFVLCGHRIWVYRIHHLHNVCLFLNNPE